MSNVVSFEKTNPAGLVSSLSPQDKKIIMNLCMPKGATDGELALYLYRCKEMGFDPLSGELILQRWGQGDEAKLSFITTRDALLRKAAEHVEYQGINSGVVREGDTFLVDTEKGVVKHTFGAKRGTILVGWAVVYRKGRVPVIQVADFKEYLAANQKNPVWRSMPSAMIQKVAEAAALRRQFPLGVSIYTKEELYVDEVEAVEVDAPTQQTAPTPTITVEAEEEVKAASKQEVTTVEKEEAAEAANVAPEQTKETVVKKEKVAPKPETPATGDIYTLVDVRVGKNGNNTPYAKVQAKKGNEVVLLLAKGDDGLAEVAKLTDGCTFKAQTVEASGFVFIKEIYLV